MGQAQNLHLKVSTLEQKVAWQNITVRILETDSSLTLDTNYVLALPDLNYSYKITITAENHFSRQLQIRQKRILKSDTIYAELESFEGEMDEVIVISTRTKNNLENLATRVEVVNNDEMNERSLDKPSNVSHCIKEQTGVQLQRTSASSGAANIRLQSLRGKYVQIMKDGMPIFGGLSQNFSLPQFSPLDLNQIEIIKGSSSTLNGGDAIAGIINLISKAPNEQPEYDILINGETTKSFDVGAYANHKVGKFGYTLLGQYRNQQAFDWDKDSFSDYPKLQRWNLTPDIYFYPTQNITLSAGATYINETRAGGAMPAVQNKADSNYTYIENNKSEGVQARLKADLNFDKFRVVLRSGINFYKRDLDIPTYSFSGNQIASVSDIVFHIPIKRHKIVVGIDFRTDQFRETTNDTFLKRDYQLFTPGIFIQETFVLSEQTVLEGGFRLDYNTHFKVVPLPKVAWLQKWNEVFHSRINFGMGYKLPTIFQDESEENFYQNIIPIENNLTKPEISYGGNLDLKVISPNIKGLQIIFNEMFFITHITNPLIAKRFLSQGEYYTRYQSESGFIQGRGIETTLQMSYRGVVFKGSYTLQDQSRKVNNIRSIAPLTSKHLVGLLLGYEKEDRFSIGIDCYYFSKSQLSDGRTTQEIWEMGINGQVITKYITFFANAENILNIRQTSFGPVVLPSPTFNQPRFKEIYGPLEGRIFNFGCKVKLGKLFKNKTNRDDD